MKQTEGREMESYKHSGLGIASFTISIVSGVFIFLILAILGVMEATTPGGIDEESPVTFFIGLLLLTFIGASFLAFGLGMGGLAQKERKKIFAVLGTVLAAAPVIITLFFMVLGLAAG